MSQTLIHNETRAEKLNKSYAYHSRPMFTEEANQVIEVLFPQENDEKKMAIRRLNVVLCMILSALIAVTMFGYYFATASEMELNKLSKQTTIYNDENADLQLKLDALKSFHNVDKSLQKSNTLTKAKQVIEIPAVNVAVSQKTEDTKERPVSWAIGY